MAIVPFLAMTAAEMHKAPSLPAKTAWMACHFSPYGTGLSNLPKALPPGSLLILDDVTPPHAHDPVLISEQLTHCAEMLQCRGILLDFQRRDSRETSFLTERLVQSLPCPTAVAEPYADSLDCPVFLSPVPPSMPLDAHLSPWKGRSIWLELSLEGEILTLTEQGCSAAPLPCPEPDSEHFHDSRLHCCYTIEAKEKAVSFTLWRNPEGLQKLLEEAEALGVTGTVGLFQELHGFAEQ